MSKDSTENRFFPKDTFNIFSNFKLDYNYCNFFYLFNKPNVEMDNKNYPKKIKLNEEILNYKWNKDLLGKLIERRENLINHLQHNGFKVENSTAECAWRLIIGLGAAHPQETSMTLHHIYGIPYIPGSAIKGVTKHYVVIELADKYRKDFKTENNKDGFKTALKKISEALDKGEDLELMFDSGIKFEELIKIFGNQKQQGKVIFMDAYPVGDINLKIDIMNPHYPGYYSGNNPPADWQNPNPIKFLTVEKTKFQFILISKDENLLGKANYLLKRALENFGVGAKTSLGYGLFEFKEENK